MKLANQKFPRPISLLTPLVPTFAVAMAYGLYQNDIHLFVEIFKEFILIGYLSFLFVGLPLYLVVFKISSITFKNSIFVGLLSGLLIALGFTIANIGGYWWQMGLVVSAFTLPCGLIGGIVFWFLGIRESKSAPSINE